MSVTARPPLSRAALRKALNANGVPTGAASDGEVATIVEFADYWGVMPGVTASAETAAVKAALDAERIVWTMGNMVLVAKAGA